MSNTFTINIKPDSIDLVVNDHPGAKISLTFWDALRLASRLVSIVKEQDKT